MPFKAKASYHTYTSPPLSIKLNNTNFLPRMPFTAKAPLILPPEEAAGRWDDFLTRNQGSVDMKV
jgi:hypothetical protein